MVFQRIGQPIWYGDLQSYMEVCISNAIKNIWNVIQGFYQKRFYRRATWM